LPKFPVATASTQLESKKDAMERRIIRYDRPAPTTAATGQVSLEIVRGRARNKLRSVEARAFLIGSATDCDLVLGDPHFPPVHAYLLRSLEATSIRWLGSGPALSINGREAIESEPLADQDLIRTGPYEFRVHIEPSGGSPEPQSSAVEQLAVKAARARKLAES
jgi:predicted component of type VI protein secretion system